MGKYEEALERARQGKPIDEVFPELKESEDERRRKGLIEIFNSALGQDFLQRKAGLDRDKVIAYLEKQKEPKPAEWSEADEEMLDAMIDIVSNSLYEPLCPREGMLIWLKALRSGTIHKGNPHWRPSEEQMIALYKAAQESPIIKENGNYLYDLYDDLRKLM